MRTGACTAGAERKMQCTGGSCRKGKEAPPGPATASVEVPPALRRLKDVENAVDTMSEADLSTLLLHARMPCRAAPGLVAVTQALARARPRATCAQTQPMRFITSLLSEPSASRRYRHVYTHVGLHTSPIRTSHTCAHMHARARARTRGRAGARAHTHTGRHRKTHTD